MNQPKPRGEMDARWTWDLSDILENDPAYEAMYARAQKDIEALAGFAGRVASDPLAALQAYFAIEYAVEKLYTWSRMRLDTDGGDAAAQALFARAQGLAARAESAGAFFRPEMLSMPEDALRALSDDPAYARYDAFLRDIVRHKPHTLPAEQEKLLALAGEALNAPNNVFTMLSDVDMPFPDVPDDQGGRVRLSGATYGRLIRSRDRAVRKAAYEGMMNAYGAFRQTIAAAYRGSVQGDVFSARARRFDSALSASLFPDAVPQAVYDGLLTAVEGALPAMNRYLSLRKKALGVDELHLYDLYVPIVGDYDMKMSYPEAFQLVRRGLRPLGERYGQLLDRAYSERWIDVYENRGKHAGAYSWGVYGAHPYVLLNHNDDLSGAMTLAHELGHAMHSFHSNEKLPYEKANYSLFVAEVASTCNEMLLMRALLEEYKDDRKASAFLCNQLLEEFRGTVFRQAMFAAFERESHRMEEMGTPLTADTLSQAHYALNQQFYGDVCVIDDCVRHEWLRIPHFYRAFYVYKYATGFSAAVYIANRILTEGQPAVEDYFRFLSAGGSVPPLQALRYAGVDMENPATVQSALTVFADTVTRLEALL